MHNGGLSSKPFLFLTIYELQAVRIALLIRRPRYSRISTSQFAHRGPEEVRKTFIALCSNSVALSTLRYFEKRCFAL